MKTSTEIDSIAKKVGEERAVEYIAKAGFDAWDFSMFNMAVPLREFFMSLWPTASKVLSAARNVTVILHCLP